MSFGEPGKLRAVVEAHIEQPCDVGIGWAAEEALSRALCKTDCAGLHGSEPPINLIKVPLPAPRACTGAMKM